MVVAKYVTIAEKQAKNPSDLLDLNDKKNIIYEKKLRTIHSSTFFNWQLYERRQT